MAFLYDLPTPVKAVVTTRERVLLYSPIRLEQLLQEAALNLIGKESHEKDAGISQAQALKLYNHIGGIPAALIYAIGQVASGYSVETVLDRVPRVDSDIARFCFEGSMEPLRGKPAHHLLMAIAMFPKPPIREALAFIAGYQANPITVEEGLAQLRKISLLREQEGRYAMLPLTREYALYQVLADVVDVAAHRGEDDGAFLLPLDPLHERFEIADRGLHRLGRLQDEGQLHLAGAEQVADRLHPRQQNVVDDVERLVALHREAAEIGFETLPVAIDDALGEPVFELFRTASFFSAFSIVRSSNSAMKACSGS